MWNEILATYLPQDRRHALARQQPLPERGSGAVLFADLSGFTPLTEGLVQALGARRGAEEVALQINQVYEALITHVHAFGGSIIGFAGDSLTCYFEQDLGEVALACGWRMQRTMDSLADIALPTGEMVALALKVGIAAGPVRRFLVGDPTIQVLEVLAGDPLLRAVAAERHARRGEVLVDEVCALTLVETLRVAEWREDEESAARYAVVGDLLQSVPEQPWPDLDATLSEEQLRPWVLPLIYERLKSGAEAVSLSHPVGVTELRPAVALFARFGGIDYDEDEAASQKLDSYVRWVQHLAARYEGTLLDLTLGDKGSYLYIALGAPLAHEDDALRALHVARALCSPPPEFDYIGPPQIGLGCGIMRTGSYGGHLRRTYGVLGDEVNVAARLMQEAAPGQIVASRTVQVDVGPGFAWSALTELQVKGKQQPLSAFVFLGEVEPSDDPTPPDAYALPMIGRQNELSLVRERMARASAGRGQIVGIAGEAGIGKSRLVAEIIRQAPGYGFSVYRGECQSYGTQMAYLAWQPLWRALFGLRSGSTLAAQRERLATALRDRDPRLLDRLPLLAPLLNLPLEDNDLTQNLEAAFRKEALEALLVSYLKGFAATTPLLLIIEDVHWLDPLSGELLDAIGRALAPLPIFLLLTYRPSHLPPATPLGVRTLPHYTEIVLEELTAEEIAHLVQAKLSRWGAQDPAALAALAEALLARTQGNPFYTDEVLNYLHDQGVAWEEVGATDTLELPASLHSLILSRVDQLHEQAQLTLKVASVVGAVFPAAWLWGYYPALGEPSQVRQVLEQLSQQEMTRLATPEPELAYLFRHILAQEVVYESLPYEMRALLHEQLASYLEERAAENISHYVDLLAYHYSRSKNQSKKQRYLCLAGEAAQAAHANRAAGRYFEQALPLLPEPEQGPIFARIGRIQKYLGEWDKVVISYQRALSLASAYHNPHLIAEVQSAMGGFLRQRGNYAEAEEWLEEAHASYTALQHPTGRGQVLLEKGALLWRQGRFEAAVAALRESLNLAQSHGDVRTMLRAQGYLGNIAYQQGDVAYARSTYESCLASAQTHKLADLLPSYLNNLGLLALNQGDLETAQEKLEGCLARHEEIGDRRGMGFALKNLGLVAYRQGDMARARTLLEESLQLRRELDDSFGINGSLRSLALVAIREGALEEATLLLQECRYLCETMGYEQGMLAVHNLLGLLALRQSNLKVARGHFKESLRASEPLDDRQEIACSLVGLAALAGRRGRVEGAVQSIAVAQQALRERNLVMEPVFQALYDEVYQQGQRELSAETFTESWERGSTMPLAEALSALPPSP